MAVPLYRERYEPLALAGRGAQGEVWMAHDHHHDRKVALKIRRIGADREAMLREARTLLDMRPHEGLPLVRDDFFADDRYVIVMDWIEGTDLASSDKRAFEDVLDKLDAVARALDHLHAHDPPIVHRDVKPSNIVVTPDGRTVLVDFGLSGTTTAHYRQGTPAFAAPEVAAGRDATPASDVFGLAVTALVLITGEVPEPGRAPDWSSVPDVWRDRIRRALEDALSFDPRLRPRTAGELVASLRPPSSPNNLPAALSSFVGRDVATAELRGLVSSTRLVTLVGPGGSGKTRLALRVADAALSTFAGGVWLAELGGVTEPDLVASRVAVALGVRSDARPDVVDALTDFLQTGEQLLVLDNCEHVIDACAHLAETLLRGCPDLTILATSREPLRVSGETVWNVTPLEPTEAIALFADRVPHGSAIAPGDTEIVADVCRRLDGIPLAIELAAAQLGRIDLTALVSALDEALGVLTGGTRTNPRQETLRATIDWSHELLSDDERTALRRLSVFAGGFTNDASERVCDARAWGQRLVESSLATRDGDRFRLLETVRQFASDKLNAAGETSEVRARHLRWVTELVEHPATSMPAGWLDRLSADHDNLEAALSYAVAEQPAVAAQLVCSAVTYWARRGHWAQGRRWVDKAIDASKDVAPEIRARLLKAAGDMARVQGDMQTARSHLEEALALCRQSPDRSATAWALNSLGLVAQGLGDLESASACYLEGAAIARELDDPTLVANVQNNLAIVHNSRGETAEATRLFEENLAIARENGWPPEAVAAGLTNLATMRSKGGDYESARRDFSEALDLFDSLKNDYGRAAVLQGLGTVHLREGDLAAAAARLDEALEITRRLGDKSGVADALQALGEIAYENGDLDGASKRHEDALVIRRDLGDPLAAASSLDNLGVVDVARGDAGRAARRFGEAHALRTTAGVSAPADDDLDATIAKARDALGSEAFEREWGLGAHDAD